MLPDLTVDGELTVGEAVADLAYELGENDGMYVAPEERLAVW